MKTIDDSKTVAQNKELNNRFEEERKKWNNDIIELVKCLGNTNKLAEAQVTQLSYRQTEYFTRKDLKYSTNSVKKEHVSIILVMSLN